MASVFGVAGSRLQVYLPVNTNPERLAAVRVVDHLHNHHGGVTHSELTGRIFRGYWYDAEDGTLYQDEIALAWSDVPQAPDDPVTVSLADDLRAFAASQYATFGCEQEEIWVTVTPVQFSS